MSSSSSFRVSLPNEHLLAIFTRLPARTLLRVPLICSHWASIQPTACRSFHSLTLAIVGEGKTSQTSHLINSPFPVSHLHQNRILTFSQFITSQETQSLISLFPVIYSLNIVHREYHSRPSIPEDMSISKINCLLRKWSPRLTQLGVYGFRRDNSAAAQSTSLLSLLSTINTLPVLKNLTIDVSNYFIPFSPKFGTEYRGTLYLPILTRLEYFSFKSAEKTDILSSSIIKFGGTISEFRLGSDKCSHENVLRSLEQTPDLLQRITHFHYGHWILPSTPHLSVICWTLPNLNFLSLVLNQQDSYSIKQVVQLLSSLLNLRTLQLKLENLANCSLGCEQIEQLSKLPSIRRLILHPGFIPDHTVLSSKLPAAWLFPNLEFFKLSQTITHCSLCAFDYRSNSDLIFSEQGKFIEGTCLRLLLAPLKGCTKLTTIERGFGEYLENYGMAPQTVSLDNLFSMSLNLFNC